MLLSPVQVCPPGPASFTSCSPGVRPFFCLQACICLGRACVCLEVDEVWQAVVQVILYARAGASAAELCQRAAQSFEVVVEANFRVRC